MWWCQVVWGQPCMKCSVRSGSILQAKKITALGWRLSGSLAIWRKSLGSCWWMIVATLRLSKTIRCCMLEVRPADVQNASLALGSVEHKSDGKSRCRGFVVCHLQLVVLQQNHNKSRTNRSSVVLRYGLLTAVLHSAAKNSMQRIILENTSMSFQMS